MISYKMSINDSMKLFSARLERGSFLIQCAECFPTSLSVEEHRAMVFTQRSRRTVGRTDGVPRGKVGSGAGAESTSC